MSEKKTPDAWCFQYGLEVRDPDGWRRDNQPWDEPITLPDFWNRYCGSTARLVTEVQMDRINADVRAAKREEAEESGATGKTAPRHVRIENRNPEGKKILSGGRITIDGEDISDRIMAVDIHMDAKSLPTARLEMVGLDVDIEAVEAEPEDAVPSAVALIVCAECYSEVHNGRRDTPNPAVIVAGGNSACADHIYFTTPALPDRTPGGIILGGANGSLN